MEILDKNNIRVYFGFEFSSTQSVQSYQLWIGEICLTSEMSLD